MYLLVTYSKIKGAAVSGYALYRAEVCPYLSVIHTGVAVTRIECPGGVTVSKFRGANDRWRSSPRQYDLASITDSGISTGNHRRNWSRNFVAVSARSGDWLMSARVDGGDRSAVVADLRVGWTSWWRLLPRRILSTWNDSE